jgi:hypothetical protein
VIFGAGMIHPPRTLSAIVPFIQQSNDPRKIQLAERAAKGYLIHDARVTRDE